MRALITGATGNIGQKLVPHFDSSIVLSRNPERARTILPNSTAFAWQATQELPPLPAFDGVDAVVHLVGESVAEGRWTPARKKLLWDSRILSTRNLVDAMAKLERKPAVLVSASAVGIYGSRGDELLDESAAPGSDFLALLAIEWEREALRAEALGIRVALIRTAMVFDRSVKSFANLIRIFRLGGGAVLGSGKQWMPWVHMQDAVGLIVHALKSPDLKGPINVSSPNPVRNSEFTRILAVTVRRPAFFWAPPFALKMILGEFAEAVLGSQRVTPAVALATGYRFLYPELAAALSETVKRGAAATSG
jgi:uncharacterized protein (TIGR01777 family)